MTLLQTFTTPAREFLLFTFRVLNQQIKENVRTDSTKAW
jgi:hypothetical protein